MVILFPHIKRELKIKKYSTATTVRDSTLFLSMFVDISNFYTAYSQKKENKNKGIIYCS